MELWLQNLSKADINLSDIGVRVLMGKNVNVFAYNPVLKLNPELVKKSLKEGSIGKRVDAGLLTVINGKPKQKRPADLDILKESNKPLVRKTRSAVFIEPNTLEEDGELDFADYGVNDVIANKDNQTVCISPKIDIRDPLVQPEDPQPKSVKGIAQHYSQVHIEAPKPIVEELETQPTVLVEAPIRKDEFYKEHQELYGINDDKASDETTLKRDGVEDEFINENKDLYDKVQGSSDKATVMETATDD